MLPTGTFLLTNTGFSKDEPVISLSNGHEFVDFSPVKRVLSMTFNTSQRYCVGWRDITTGERFLCVETQQVESKYEQCAVCQKKTGFNPAFYHATSVSPQQEARNQTPHILYIAYFGGDIIKVGISHAARGNNRLLEQGARTAIILDTFPTAMIARQYEARIAALPGIAETVAVRQKIAALTSTYDSVKLQQTAERIQRELSVTFSNNKLIEFDSLYFSADPPDFTHIYDTTDLTSISGQTVGVMGSLLFCTQQDTLLALPLKKFVGYKVTITATQKELDLPARQLTLL